MPQYIWQHENWTAFSYNAEAVLPVLSRFRKKQGYFLRQIHELGFTDELNTYAKILEEEAVQTSAIEGIVLNREGVRSSIANHLGIAQAGLREATREMHGLVTVLLEAVHNYLQPLDKSCLFRWHSLLFLSGISDFRIIEAGNWRKTKMQVVSGAFGRQKVHFEAPLPENVEDEMQGFFAWWKNTQETMDGIIRTALAHLYFVTVHPFEDGNGRLARILSDIALAQDEDMAKRFYSVSAQIMKERSSYYDILEKTQKGDGDCTEWLVWFIGCLERSITSACFIIENILAKAEFWKKHRDTDLNERQRKVINRLLDAGKDGFEGGLTTQKYCGMTKCSRATAFRDIEDLLAKNILSPLPKGGRSTAYAVVV